MAELGQPQPASRAQLCVYVPISQVSAVLTPFLLFTNISSQLEDRFALQNSHSAVAYRFSRGMFGQDLLHAYILHQAVLLQHFRHGKGI